MRFPHSKLPTLCLLGCLGLAARTSATNGRLSGSGTAASPYLVADYADLRVLGQGSYSDSAVYRLVADIDASASASDHSDSGFAPFYLHGALHGGGHSISSLVIARPGEHNVALVRYLDSNAVLDSLHLVGASVSGSWRVGALVAYGLGSVQGCSASGRIVGATESASVGGLLGMNWGTVAGCSWKGTVRAANRSLVGGLVAYNCGRVLECQAGDSVVGGRAGLAGGLVGGNDSGAVVSGSVFRGTVMGTDSSEIGGLVGSNKGALRGDSSMAEARAIGSVAHVGGLVGLNLARIDSCVAGGSVRGDGRSTAVGGLVGSDVGSLRACQAHGSASASGVASFAGGLVGFGMFDTVRGSFATGAIVKNDSIGSAGGLVGGEVGTLLQESFATGAVSVSGAGAAGGGLVGIHKEGRVVNCFATGAVTGTGVGENLGGLVGLNEGIFDTSYATGRVTVASGSLAGGVVGLNNDSVVACYWNVESSGQSRDVSGPVAGSYILAYGVSSAQMASQGSFFGWDFDSVWSLAAGDSAPVLRCFGRGADASLGIHGGTAQRAGELSWHVVDGRLEVCAPGRLDVSLRDLSGRLLGRATGSGSVGLGIPSRGLVLATVRTSSGARSFEVPSVR